MNGAGPSAVLGSRAGDDAPSMSGPRDRSGAYDWLAEAALATVTVVAAAGMSRLFTDTSFRRDVMALALAAHILAAAARRVGLPTIVAALVGAVSFTVTVTVLRYADTAWFVLPTSDTLDAVGDHLRDGWAVMIASASPVAPVPGLVLAAGTVLGIGAFFADTLAFRLKSSVAAVVPSSIVFWFSVAAGTGEGAVRHGAAYAAAVGLAIAALWLRSRSADIWVEPRPGRGTLALARVGSTALVLAVAVGAAAGPDLPGARAEPWVDLSTMEVTDAAPWVEQEPPEPEPWADFGAPRRGESAVPAGLPEAGPRVLVSPLVQIRSRLVQLSERELFTVEVPIEQRQYWRLTSLDTFDGNGWRARSQYEPVVGGLPPTLEASAAASPIIHTVALTGLGNSYLPVAYEPRRVLDGGGVEMEYEAATGSLIKARQAALAGPDRFTYTVESAVPRIDDPDRLRGADASLLDPEFLATNTDLPDEARDVVGAEALRVTAGAGSDYHRAVLLQDYFRLDGGFRYDLDVEAGPGVDSLEDFLFDVRAGYCQQFASAFAAMARSIGLPTRVAVGFTWGEWDPARRVDGAYVVRGEHAHAWPEVYFARTGWVRFEPTPGRGAPGDFPVTGHVANQQGSDPEPPEQPDEEPEPDDAANEAGGSGRAPTGTPEPGDEPDPGSEAGGSPQEAAAAGSDRWSLADGGAGALAVLVVVGLALAVAAVPVLGQLHRERRRARLVGDPPGLIEEWWSESLEALGLVGLARRPGETPLDLARRVSAARPALGPMEELARIATHGRYARATPASMAVRAGVLGSRVRAECHSQANLASRLGAAFNPMRALARRRPS